MCKEPKANMIKTYLGNKGYSIYKNKISINEQQFIREQLNVAPYMPKSPVKPIPFPVYLESSQKLYIPRYFGIEHFGDPDEIRISHGENIQVDFKGDLRDYQKTIVDKYIQHVTKSHEGGGGLIELQCGGGKCLAIDTPVLMYNGTIKMVQDILIGDQIMGDDSNPRNVLSLARGKETMYKIIPEKGESYTVNESHILSLKCSRLNNNKIQGETIIDISVADYLNLPKSDHEKGPFLAYKVPVNFSEKAIEIDPYVFGYSLNQNKKHYNHIPHNYKCNCQDIQLKILAGILDAVGYYKNNTIVISQKNEQLLDDIIFIANSLGFGAYKNQEKQIGRAHV